jgi:hypothetical protein
MAVGHIAATGIRSPTLSDEQNTRDQNRAPRIFLPLLKAGRSPMKFITAS